MTHGESEKDKLIKKSIRNRRNLRMKERKIPSDLDETSFYPCFTKNNHSKYEILSLTKERI